jgi:hypothetical protein
MAMVEVSFHLALCKKSISLGMYINKLLLEPMYFSYIFRIVCLFGL